MAIRVFALGGIGVSIYLAISSFGATTLAGCGSDALLDCDHVLNSRWATWFGIPVSVFAILAYAGIFGLSFVLNQRREFRVAFRTLGFVVGFAALWFTGLQIFAVQKLCTYCLVVHFCGIVTCGLVVALSVLEYRNRRRAGWSNEPTGYAFIALMVLIGGQLVYAPQEFEVIDMGESDGTVAQKDNSKDGDFLDNVLGGQAPLQDIAEANADKNVSESSDNAGTTTDSSTNNGGANSNVNTKKKDQSPPRITDTGPLLDGGPDERQVSIMRGNVKLQVSQYPVIGDPESTDVFVKLFDYSCPDCRRLHGQIEAFQQAHTESVAVLLVPVPMNTDCNPNLRRTHPRHVNACEYSRLALAVWQTDPDKYKRFHDWMMKDLLCPPLDKAEEFAQSLLGVDDVTAIAEGPEVNRTLGRVLRVYANTIDPKDRQQSTIVPKLFVRNKQIVGAPEDPSQMVAALKNIIAQTPAPKR